MRTPGCRSSGTTGAIHLDLHVADARRRAVELGAVAVGGTVMRSPAGLTFCLVGWHGERTRPGAVIWPGGQRSLVTEAEFWAALTGWARRPIPRSEFEFLARPDGMPLRLLLRRVQAGPGGMHVDFACDGVEREVKRMWRWARRTCVTVTGG
jgi:hypothetical protein